MIYTVTMNPAIDYVMEVGALDSGGTNRSRGESYYPGGKGINVSVVLKSLGMESTALGFTGRLCRQSAGGDAKGKRNCPRSSLGCPLVRHALTSN